MVKLSEMSSFSSGLPELDDGGSILLQNVSQHGWTYKKTWIFVSWGYGWIAVIHSCVSTMLEIFVIHYQVMFQL